MREVIILDCEEIRCPEVLVIVFEELCGAMRRKGMTVRVAGHLEEIHDDAIVFLGNFIHIENPASRLAIQSRHAIYIGWYWHEQDVSALPYFIHVYENVCSTTLMEDKVAMMSFMRSQPNTCPLLLRANEDPERIGSYPRTYRYDYCFMGGRMCDWLVPSHRYHGLYYGVHDTSLYMSYEDRRDIYLSSIFALGFQTDDNIRNGHVSQRIFEGLAYGCIVLSHSLHACQQTEGIVEYVEPDRDKIADRMAFLLDHPEYRREKQLRGYDFIRRKGTNTYAIGLLSNKVLDLYHIDAFM